MVKPGTRALGVAESYRSAQSTLAGAVVNAAGRADGFAFGSCTVGGLDATDTILDIWATLDREDIEYCLIAGVALAWFNVLDLDRLGDELPLPTYAITFEKSDGLADDIAAAFDGEAADIRQQRYRALPPRRRIEVGGNEVFVRAVNVGDREPAEVLDAYTNESQRPEPLRVAHEAARAVDRWRTGDRSR